MSIGSEQDLHGLQRVSEVVKEALTELQAAVEPGITPAELDAVCGHVFQKHSAFSAPRLLYGAPVNAFISVNDVVVHGLPTKRKLQPGDVVKLDVTPILNGYVADAARTVVVPPASKIASKLVQCAESAFWAAMRVVRAGKPLNGVGRVVEREAKKFGFSVIRELAGHGVGRAIHEEPEVLNFYHPDFHRPLTNNLVIAVEPMVAAGKGAVAKRRDGWTISTRDGSLTAHYENTVVVQKGRPLVLTV